MATFTALRNLHSLIGDALADIERVFVEYQSSLSGSSDSQNSPCSSPSSTNSPPSPVNTNPHLNRPLDFPSLDDLYDPSSPSEALLSHPSIVHATKLIVASTGQLTAMVQRPFLTICDASMGYHLPSCMRFLEASHTVEILREAGPHGLHAHEIATRIGCDASKLSHILRLLATHHICREVSPNVFANNRLSSFMDSGKSSEDIAANPVNKYEGTNGIAAFVGMCADELFKSSAYLTDAYLFNPSSKYSSLPSASPFNLAFHTKHQFFTWLEDEGNQLRFKRFGRAMMGTAGWEDGGGVSQSDGFDWGGLASESLIVDVGGGIGSTSMSLANTFPHLRFCVQDRPKTVEMGLLAWKSKCPELLDSGRVRFQAHDFFTHQPVQNAAVFLLRVITHDWPDAFVTRILLQLRHAAMPGTKLIMADYILPLACEDDTDDTGVVKTLAPPGSGLLPNLGKASANAFWLDMTMHVTFNSQERTLREMTDLALTAGWKVTEVVRKPEGSLFGSIVAVPVPVPPSQDLISPIIDQEIDERCASPVVDTFYSRVELPATPGRSGMTGSVSDSAVMRMKQRIRKTLSRTFRNSFGVVHAGADDEKDRPQKLPVPLLPAFSLAESNDTSNGTNGPK